MLESDLLKEKSKLKEIISTINCVLVDEKKDLEELYSSPIIDEEQFWLSVNRRKLHITNLETSLEEP